jgi:hypothetical protein
MPIVLLMGSVANQQQSCGLFISDGYLEFVAANHSNYERKWMCWSKLC